MIPCQRHLSDMPDDVAYLNCAYMSPLMKPALEAETAALFQDGVVSVPQCQSEAETLLIVGEPREAGFAQAVGARPRLVM